MTFTTIISEGNLVPADLLEQMALGEAQGQRPDDFGFEKSRRLIDEIAAAWSDAREYWSLFQRRLETLTRQGRLREDDPATSLTREFWVERLLETLGYSLTSMRSAAVVQSRTYFISHRAGADESAPPIHIEGIRTRLDQRPPSGRPRLSPHALLQEYLNATEHLWGIVTNGERLRLLRDSSRTTRPTYVEFDLRAMLEGEKFSEFAILYRLLHRSRLPQAMDDAPRCLLETYHQQAVEAGGRVREGLRDGVETALLALGKGLLAHPANATLRQKVAAGKLPDLEFYRQLLRLVYRLLFLMVAEERRLVPTADDRPLTTDDRPLTADEQLLLRSSVVGRPSSSVDGAAIYREHYSVARLRRLAERRMAGQARHGDLWMGLLATFRLLQDEEGAQALGLAALDGDLFGPGALPDLHDTRLSNEALLIAIRALSLYRDPRSKALRRVNYGALDVEELGSVYESLLDYRPVVERQKVEGKRQNDSIAPATGDANADPFAFSLFTFTLVSGSERKTTGSYYTRPELVHELIKSALEPVIEERLKAATTDHRPLTTEQRSSTSSADSRSSVVGRQSSAQEEALLSIRICDPACGSGHFLLAAARRLGRELARVRSGEDQPAPEQFRLAMREVIARCIYGVDANPLAVDLCKVALWLESLSPGMPLSFLDAHIRWGNSLIGARRDLVDAGIPDDAYKPVTGDDKAAASAFRRRNAKERKAHESGQAMLPLDFGEPRGIDTAARAARQLNAMPDDSVRAVREKAAAYERLRLGDRDTRALYDLWTAAFFLPLADANDPTIPTTQSIRDFEQRPAAAHGQMIGRATELAQQIGFFHWELEFPDVFERSNAATFERSNASSGFDVVLGNPPWEQIELKEEEHWVDVYEIRDAPNKAAREKKIQEWRQGDARQRARVAQFDQAKYRPEAESRFMRASGRFSLTAVGRMNTYALFAEHSHDILAPTGRSGIIVPTGIVTDDTTKDFFGHLIENQSLMQVIGFENEAFIFQNVHHSFRFCGLIISGSAFRIKAADLVFFCRYFDQLLQAERHFTITREEINLISPNTRTCPIFRTCYDAELTKQIYQRIPVLVNEHSSQNTWSLSFRQGLFNMASDSYLFVDKPGNDLLPLYEAKMMHQFTHRWATYDDTETRDMTISDLVNTDMSVKPRYWVHKDEVVARLDGRWDRPWFLGFRDVCRAHDERTTIFSLIPRVAVGHKMPLVFFDSGRYVSLVLCFYAVVNSLTLDYITRQKLGGASLSYFILKQLPVLPPDRFSAEDIAFIVPRVLELVYTAWDMRPFAEDVWQESSQESGVRSQEPDADEGGAGGAGGVRDGVQGLGVDVGNVLGTTTGAGTRNSLESGGSGGTTSRPAGGAGDGAAPPGNHAVASTAPSPLQAEILRRNAECNADADPALFAPRDGFVLPPFRWDERRRALIRAELDARIAKLYGLTRDELRYILDPADVYGPDFPGETFRVLKEKETRLYGEYRTRRLVLEAWDRENGS